MRRLLEFSALCIAGAITACSLDEVVKTENIPTAGVRFINAVPDTQAVDSRFVDRVENSAHWNMGFRDNPVTSSCVTSSTQIQYKNTRAGQRHFRIFLSDTLQAVASTVVKDTTVTVEANKKYSALLWGYSRTGSTPAMRLTFLEDNPPDPGNQVALRVINTSRVAIDVRHYPSTGTPPPAAGWANITPLSVSGYILARAGQIGIELRHAGGTTLLAQALALPGNFAATDSVIPGTTIAGSAVSAIFFDPPVAGSKAPQTAAFQTTTGSTTLYATDTSFARTSGSFIADCFFVGQQVTVSGFSAANNGPFVITAMPAAPTTGSTTLEATATGYRRAAGSFVTNGFKIGQQVTASGFATAANNGRSTIIAVTATDLTVTKSTP